MRRFWASIPDDDIRKQHVVTTMLERPDVHTAHVVYSCTVTLILHGDGVPVSQMSMTSMSWSGVLASAAIGMQRRAHCADLMKRQRRGVTGVRERGWPRNG